MAHELAALNFSLQCRTYVATATLTCEPLNVRALLLLLLLLLLQSNVTNFSSRRRSI